MQEGISSHAEDLEIIHLVLHGETEQFRGIVEKYQSMIFRLCGSFLRNAEEAEDAAQEIFLRAFKSLHTFKLGKQFSTWLYTIGVNHLKKRYSKIREISDQKELPSDDLLKAEGTTPEELLGMRELKQEVRLAVFSLPEQLKTATVLYYLEDLSVQEIAEVMDLGVENVKSRLHRARKKLKSILEKPQPQGEQGGI